MINKKCAMVGDYSKSSYNKPALVFIAMLIAFTLALVAISLIK